MADSDDPTRPDASGDDPLLPWPVAPRAEVPPPPPAAPPEGFRYAPPPPPVGPPPVAPWPAAPPRATSRRPRFVGALVAVATLALLAGTAVGIAVTDSTQPSGISAGGSSSGIPTEDGSSGNGSFGSSSSSSTTSTDVNVRKIATSVSPAIVNIAATLSSGNQTAGSGVVISKSGLVLTNNHVINGATRVEVEIGVTRETFNAEVLGYDIGDDVALLQLDSDEDMQTVETADSSTVSRNDPVIAIGNALGRFGEPTVVTGTVTALHQGITAGDGVERETLEDMIRIAASIQPGDSGGALLNIDGQVIGINTAADTGGGSFGFQSGTTGFAIPIERALAIAHQIKAGDEANGVHVGGRAMLGVLLAEADEGFGANAGAEVTGTGDDSPAADAGIGEGDTITALGGRTVRSGDQLRTALNRYHPDEKVRVTWIDSSGDSHRATVTLTEGPPA